MKGLFITAIFLASAPAISQADIYRFQDQDGRVYYSPEKKSDSYTLIIKSIKTNKSKEQLIKKQAKKSAKTAAEAAVATIEAEKPDNRTPIERYHGDTDAPREICSLMYQRFLLRHLKTDFKEFEDCVLKVKEKSSESLKKALEMVSNVRAKEALKDYHVLVITELKSIMTGDYDEEIIDYKQRHRALENRITEAWERFEIERNYQTERDSQALKPEMPFIFLK